MFNVWPSSWRVWKIILAENNLTSHFLITQEISSVLEKKEQGTDPKPKSESGVGIYGGYISVGTLIVRRFKGYLGLPLLASSSQRWFQIKPYETLCIWVFKEPSEKNTKGPRSEKASSLAIFLD